MTTSPVFQALVSARMQDEPTAFGKWAIVRGVKSLPALPMHVAGFVSDLATAGRSIKQIWPLIEEISRAHLANNLADPCAGGVVADMINSIGLVDPPRSWAGAEKQRFKDLPYDLQCYVAGRERQRDREINRAQAEAAEARKQLSHYSKPIEEKNCGTTSEQPVENTFA